MTQLAVPIVFLDKPCDLETVVEEFSLVQNALKALKLKLPNTEPQVTYNISNKHNISAHLLRLENSCFL